MHTAWTPPLRWVFSAATLLGLFSTLQAYRLTALNSHDPELGYLLVLNLALWYIHAAWPVTGVSWLAFLGEQVVADLRIIFGGTK